MPASVGVIPRVVRFSSVVPNSASIRAIRRLMIDFATPSRRAARANPPLVITSTNALISCKSNISMPRQTLKQGTPSRTGFFVGRAESTLWMVVERCHSTPGVPFHRLRCCCLKQNADLLLHSELLGTPRKALIVHERFEFFYVSPKMWDFVGILKAHEIVQCGLDPMIRSIER